MEDELTDFRAVPQRWNGPWLGRRFGRLIDLLEDEFRHINKQLRKIRMTQAELAEKLGSIGASLSAAVEQLNKALAEIKAAIEKSGETTPEVDAALQKAEEAVAPLSEVAQSLDDLNPDA